MNTITFEKDFSTEYNVGHILKRSVKVKVFIVSVVSARKTIGFKPNGNGSDQSPTFEPPFEADQSWNIQNDLSPHGAWLRHL